MALIPKITQMIIVMNIQNSIIYINQLFLNIL
jgi:hypothetical protein